MNGRQALFSHSEEGGAQLNNALEDAGAQCVSVSEEAGARECPAKTLAAQALKMPSHFERLDIPDIRVTVIAFRVDS